MMETRTGVRLKEIPCSPNADYMAGEDGRVYSRTKYAGFGRKVYVDWYPLVGHKGKKGYVLVSLCHNNVKVTKSVHRLVCMAFHGMPPTESAQVRHLDGNPSNNLPENLRWGTQSENWLDRIAHGRVWQNSTYKLTPEERQHLRWALRKKLCSQRHAARMLGMSQSSISQILATKGNENER